MQRYVLATNVWNEETKIPAFVERMSQQTLLPTLWIWIDDGSTDRSADVILTEMKRTSIPIRLFKMPPKNKGNLDTIGVAYDKVLPTIRNEIEADYLSLADVDTVFPGNYFEEMCAFMDQNPRIGACSGQNRGEKRSYMPMGGGKLVRWDIIRRIDHYWQLAPDSFLNIKAIQYGYEVKIRNDIVIHGEPTAGFTPKGRFRFGRRSYYYRRHPLIVLSLGVGFALRGGHGTEFLRGYIQEWAQGKWKCDDAFVRYFYSFRFRIHSYSKRIIRRLG